MESLLDPLLLENFHVLYEDLIVEQTEAIVESHQLDVIEELVVLHEGKQPREGDDGNHIKGEGSLQINLS